MFDIFSGRPEPLSPVAAYGNPRGFMESPGASWKSPQGVLEFPRDLLELVPRSPGLPLEPPGKFPGASWNYPEAS